MMRILIVALAMMGSVPAIAANYYVSAAGNDSAAGTSSSAAWRTISKVNAHTFVAGDRIHFRGGDTFAGNLVFDDDFGVPENNIRVLSYGSGRATISAGAGTAILVHNSGGFDVSNLTVIGSGGATNTGSGVRFLNERNGGVKLRHVRLRDLDVSGFRNAGIEVGAWPSDGGKSGYSNVVIERCVSHDNLDAGISTFAWFTTYAGGMVSYAHSNFTVRDCVVFNNRGIPDKGNHSGNGIVLSETDGVLIERCVAHHNGADNNHTGGGPVGIWVWNTTNAVIQHNESYANTTQTLDGGGFDLDGGVTNSVLQYNYSHDNDGAGFLLYQFPGAYPFSNNVVRYNVSENDGRRGNYAGIYAGAPVSNIQIYHNTVFTSASPSGGARAVRITSGASNVRLRNNLFVTTGGAPIVEYAAGLSGVLYQGNNYWSSGSAFAIRAGSTTHGSLGAWRTATNQEKNGGANTGFSVDPLFNAAGTGGTVSNPDVLPTLTAYELRSISPLIGAGLDLTASPWSLDVGASDFWGNTLPQGTGYDVGAHERSVVNLNNGGFEQGTTGWINWGNSTVVTSNMHSGARAIRVGTGAGGRAQSVTLSASTGYVLSGWGKVGATGETGWIGVTFYNASNTSLGQVDIAFTGTTYEGKSLPFNAPAGTVSAEVWVWKAAGIGSTFYADDLHLRRD